MIFDGSHMPVIFESDRSACLNAGMDGFLSKPVEVHSLRRVLSRAATNSSSPLETVVESR